MPDLTAERRAELRKWANCGQWRRFELFELLALLNMADRTAELEALPDKENLQIRLHDCQDQFDELRADLKRAVEALEFRNDEEINNPPATVPRCYLEREKRQLILSAELRERWFGEEENDG